MYKIAINAIPIFIVLSFFEIFCHLYMKIIFQYYSSLFIYSLLIDFSSLKDSMNRKIVKNEINKSINAQDPTKELLNI